MRRVLGDDDLDPHAVAPQVPHQPLAFFLTPFARPVMHKARGEVVKGARWDVGGAGRHVRRLDEGFGVRAEKGGDEVQAEGADFEEIVARVLARDVGVGSVAEEGVGCGSGKVSLRRWITATARPSAQGSVHG